ncbi:iron-sulfur cluster assembly scaffold protein [Candidatus Falkowbacteria bacterium]|jgi:nitrogen fixation protein NifU and related proteins|nr:iron-sulfur cluster assembly scaffold protein [Candidatus Falkowbacteria bacterium]MBT5503543.1 iron-sulfur cluster assembly scaffold protein [Candidatus Falkowbacteria bacterium]MBT6573580.1 iron-sulfur cluster assembly scaffold protein [Candidatus Falkowbacteria bacterium]MBT7348388.1 iron-sulfur cluster assembly scaffold protein [Candidatus Falkowbacteria bacterium]MBT7500658.1 iron-sulfur cluster assembly scaffold protein [Candidatus Falkowbacteria bacterium]
MQYSEELMDHFKSPRNQGQIEDADGVGEVGNIKCGDVMKIYIKVGEELGDDTILEDVKFETLGCAAAIAATSVLTELAKGKTFKQAFAITKDDIVKKLGQVPALKYHCSVLAEEGLKKAIEDYKSK